MDELLYGTRDRRGHFEPKKPAQPAPLFDFPPRPAAILRWLPHYFLPWNLFFFATAALVWAFALPDPATMARLEWGWISALFLVNSLMVLLLFGLFELRLYVRRAQGARFKYNPEFPADHKNPAFVFGRQDLDNALRTFGFGVPIWTAWEVLVLHAQAAGLVPGASFLDHPLYLVGLAVLLRLFHEAHFYCIHRLIHTPFFYRRVHSVHHNSVNPQPWSSLSMHPVEHLLYFSTAALHLLVPSHPLLAIYQLHIAGLGAVVGHIGFDRIELGAKRAVPTEAFVHYLHHKYFEVNYADGLVPFDRWFGTWHDGSPEAAARMLARYRARKAAAKARAEAESAGTGRSALPETLDARP